MSEGMALAEAAMDNFELIDLLCVIDACASDRLAGRVVPMSKAVEELRVLTGDFVSSDEDATNALTQVALERGCAVLFDEQAGADIMGLA
ncbi:hypothetical protein MJ8_25310 [Mesorhizobium sp. J8]|nr:hypothetical protein MJ8_25310 [Mesorhizobium sp. J8]